MKTAEGVTHISYSVVCPHCDETTYSDIDHAHWHDYLEFGEGKPYGIMPCPDCGEEFEMNIGDEIL
jgi:phage terminase large subunit GpA-like protein